ncbi:MAG: exosome complex RNA-binding protein Rrp4, partial [Candidatus Bathyarchaeia archaeon]
DLVVGQVVDVSMGGWIVDINSPYNAMLSVGDVTGRPFGPKLESLTNILGIGETVVAEVVAFDRTRDPSITIQNPGLGRVDGGLVVDLTPTKVPRLIGRKGSMISLIKQGTGCDIVVGQNGKVLVRGRSPNMVELVVKAVKMVEEESHTSGLTDRIAELIESEQKAKTDAKTTKTD